MGNPDHGYASELTEVARVAMASARGPDRGLWFAFLALDARLGRIVAKAGEPMLAQMRLAWWRDELAKEPEHRPRGDAVLDAIGHYWPASESALTELINAWELLLGPDPSSANTVFDFATARGGACGGLVTRLGVGEASHDARIAGEVWSLAELASHTSDAACRSRALQLAQRVPRPAKRLPRALRPLSVIEGLARRAVASGGMPLIGDRLSPLVALRLGILGR